MQGYVVKNGQELRLGYTTGSCATAAATAAAYMLLTQEYLEHVQIILPHGQQVSFVLDCVQVTSDKAFCGVKKYAGDDPDVTDGIMIMAECRRCPDGIVLKSGQGIGVVRTAGLPIAKGEPAINPVPRRMIISNLQRVCIDNAYTGGLEVTLSAPGGESIAMKTFNPRLGIEGGISILGTTGIVEPMSERAIVETIKLIMDKQALLNPKTILVTPGNYGSNFCAKTLGIDLGKAVKISNFFGESLDYIAYKKFKQVLLVGHLGKLIKLAGGIMNTHSGMADCRMEILAAHAACAGGGESMARSLMACRTTDEAADILQASCIEQTVYSTILERILFYLRYRLGEDVQVETIVFSQERVVMQSPGTQDIIRQLKGCTA